MRVILLQDIRGLGKKYDIKELADGYVNNYLLPRKLVLPATPGNMANLAATKKRLADERQHTLIRLQELKALLEKETLIFELRTDGKGKAFGSIGKETIQTALRDRGWLGPERVDIQLNHPIKSVGDYEIAVDLKNGVQAKLRFSVRSLP